MEISSRLANAAAEENLSGASERSRWADVLFESVFVENYGRMVAVLQRLVGQRDQAEELAAEVFWKLYRQPLAPEDYDNLGGWLYRTATRMALDWLRASERRHKYEQRAVVEAGKPDAGSDPLDSVLRAETCTRVRAILARLTPAQAQLLILRNSGFSYRELAEALGVKATSVGALLARAEAEFEKHYKALGA